MLEDIEHSLAQLFPAEIDSSVFDTLAGPAVYDRSDKALHEALSVPARDFLLRGGKRIRPVLFLSLVDSLGGQHKDYISLAVALEIAHNATLVIDDIEDDSALRRGQPTLHKRYGLDVAVNTGTTLHLIPLQLINRQPYLDDKQRSELCRIYSDELIRVYCGQATDIHWHGNEGRIPTTQEYYEMCRLKTGGLMRMATRFACVVTKQSPEISAALQKFAEAAGVAFQIKDDALDLTADQADFGKAVGNDITEGKMSLPVIIALDELPTSDSRQLLDILHSHTSDTALVQKAKELISQGGATDKAMKKARELLDQALEDARHSISQPACHDLLDDIAEKFITRSK